MPDPSGGAPPELVVPLGRLRRTDTATAGGKAANLGDLLALAVVVQQMVDADAAGVLFTADPTTGQRHRAVVSAAWGLGEAVV